MKTIPWRTICSFLIFLALFSLAIFMKPAKADVDSFMKENSCRFQGDVDSDNEDMCAHYLRRHSTSLFGNLYGGPLVYVSFAFVFTPFHYFNYPGTGGNMLEGASLQSANSHVYVMIDTSDLGRVVYNPATGEYVGTVYELGGIMANGSIFNRETGAHMALS